MKNSKECHLKASEYYKKNRSFFHAAKALENAIIVGKETATPEEVRAKVSRLFDRLASSALLVQRMYLLV